MTHPRHSVRFHRAVALLLLALFLGSGTTLPSADALLYHWDRPAETQQSHIEPAGGCASHVEACTLGRAAPGADAILADGPAVRVEALGAAPADLLPRAVHRPLLTVALPQTRAPPVTLA